VPEYPLYDITPFSTLDYPQHLAAIFWFAGCNMRCDYCYNRDIVFSKGTLRCTEALAFLKERIGLLDAVVLSGGEATLYNELIPFAKAIKALGFKIKLDTNGTQPHVILALLEASLIDFVSLDYKAPPSKFETTTHHKNFDAFNESLMLLINSDLDFEVRTTVHTDMLDENDINMIIEDLHVKNYRGTYYIQNFLYDENTIGKLKQPLKPLDTSKLKSLLHVKFRN
jgi:pyruvate formate lyase activating enzyme